MKRDNSLTKAFLLNVNNQLLEAKKLNHFTIEEAQDEAMKIIATIPNLVKNYFKMQRMGQINSSPFRITVYSLYYNELISKEEFGSQPSTSFKQFKKGTVGYYLCQYLHALGIYFTVWCGQIDLLMTMLGGEDVTKNFLLPLVKEKIVIVE